jgi:hypothetical protein
MDFSFFTTDNKSGYKTSEKWVSKNLPDLYSTIVNRSIDSTSEISFKERLWMYFHNTSCRPKCVNCGEEVPFRNRLDKPYGEFCSLQCFNSNKEEMIKRQKNTFQRKYNVDFYPQTTNFGSKQKLTKLLKYGNENFNNIEKIKKTKELRYFDPKYNNITQYKQTCLKKYGNENYSKSDEYKKRSYEIYSNLYPELKFGKSSNSNIELICSECKNTSEVSKQLIYERSKRNHIVCPICNPIGFKNRSHHENELCEFLESLNINYQTNTKIGDKKIEVDILIPTHNIGIEINGVYWHNELFKDENFHLDKSKYCNEYGIELIHIFEDEWIYKKSIVKSIILNKLGKVLNRIYARQCEVKELSSTDTINFLNENHIQGEVKSKVRLGLYYKNELISVMSFSKGRIIMGGKKEEWELNRFCNILNYVVIGGASKLLNFFIKNYNPTKIVSYSDNRIFNGKMYESLGFKKISISKPNYWYVINGIRKHRFNFRKSMLVKQGYDVNKTEKGIMFELKKYRIYDCGNTRWEYVLI